MADKEMKNRSRTENVILNVFFGYIAQIGIFILSFVGRRIFLKFLSADYLGINGLYSNILTILALAELGFDTAAVYSLYKPVAEKNTKLVSSLLRYFKKIYYAMAFAVFAAGLALVPFLKYLIKSDLPQRDLILYYILFLANTVVSYFVAHKVALLSANQQQRVQKMVTLSANFAMQIMHIVVLILWKNYYIYLIATVCSTVISNLILSIICSRIHPEVFKEKERVEFEKKPIIDRITSTFMYKIGAVLVNSTDNILISVLVSTVAVGFYSNYYTVVAAIQGFIAIITTSMVNSIGNLALENNPKKQIDLFNTMLLFYHGVSALGLIGFSLLFNDLITLWLGSEYLFDEKTVYIIAVNFYLTNAVSPVWMFREANGLFNKVKYLILIRAAFNIVLSVFFGMKWGVFGIFLATAVSLIITNFWVEPKILFSKIFNASQNQYWLKQIKYFLVTVVSFICSYFATGKISGGFIALTAKAVIIMIITGSMFLIVSYKAPELSKIKKLLLRK